MSGMLRKIFLAILLLFGTWSECRADIVTGLVGRYTFDTSAAVDETGIIGNGTNVGSPSYGFDADRGSVVLNVSTGPNYVDVPTDPDIPEGGESRTFAMWARIDAYAGLDNNGVFHSGGNANQQNFPLSLQRHPER